MTGLCLTGTIGRVDVAQGNSGATMTHRFASFRGVAVAALLAAAPISAPAQADYPNRAIKIIVPVPPGGGANMVPRIVAEKLAARWAQPVIIENRSGAGLNIGAQAVASAAPDGYTLLATPPAPLVVFRRAIFRPWRGQEGAREHSYAQCRNDCITGNPSVATNVPAHPTGTAGVAIELGLTRLPHRLVS